MRSAVKRVLSIAVAGPVVVAAAACSSSGTSSSTGPGVSLSSLETTSITVAAVPVGDDAGLYIAKDLGLFKAVGLNVSIDSIVSSATATQGQNDGKYEISAGNAVSYIQAQASGGSNLEIVAEGSLMQPGDQGLYVLPGSPIDSITQLKGKRIGVNAANNVGTLLISQLLSAHGMTASEVHFVPLAEGFPAMASALDKHQIDVAWLPEPYGSTDSATMGLRELADLDQGEAADFPVSWYVSTKSWAKAHPHTMTAFLYALREGQEYADTDRADIEQAMENLPAPYKVPPKFAAIMSVETYPLNVAPDIDGARVQRVAQEMQQFGMVPASFNVSSMLTP
ncbi:MAG TPA: ABC transporter substrate-binding protein [Streptosporangiaceae bacterium]